ncbi:inhibitor of nuclear factor kappa-B kinase subunit beta isoform X1 [Lethenteron reissneri]|uniref:inhibitor of nuclear factor kappa-B kinase subunit beta isoform X1 n=1 Tax=Lethenteron reissneri TaxID=7753 RepID=UPI002AB6A687|nr:inhibitor of nuclear factor kappa-B kinase subunit beta isoform X1 [Lethenteron reissneri]XP_061406711.1 inhibitor of nuclear factor kappa-B kinase subunit beta isoform X1 [Lethenteron reissneri]
MNQAAESGPWERKERLGAGGFGHVCMWQNKDNGEQRAVKTCRMELSPRNRERWVLEIQIMKRLNHPNVVSAREVPEEMEKALGPRDLPLLAMEYCSGGDLRKVLLKPENCCGMRECDVMAVIYDISQAVQYLHTNRIIHRDLKPENIVLQQQQDRVIYKIIDLGYAKELDQGSLCTSFVGTLQYLAPELFEGQKYTVSVDYWSFGTVVFECITGFRPFLPNMQPVQWHSIVIRKGPHDIVAVEEMNRDIKFSSHIPAPHNLNSVLAVQLEHWLQLMLFWNARQRGGPVDEGTGRPTCFLILDTILTSKTVHILNMVTGEVLAYTVRPDESLQHLQEQVMASTTIPVADQELLFETGIMLDPRKPVDQCLPEGCWNMSLVYLFDKSREEYGVQLRVPKIPDLVSYIVSESKTLLSYMQQRRAFGQAYHYVRSMKEHLGRLQQGQRAAMLSLLRYNSSLTKLRSFTAALAQQLKAKLEFFLSSLQLDLEKYEEQMNSGICEGMPSGLEASKKMHSAWLEMKEKAKALVQNTEVVEVDEKLLAVQGQIVALQRSPTARRQGDVLENTEQKAMELYKQLREKPSDQRVYGDSVEMVKLIIHAVQNLEKLMKELCLFLGKMVVCKNEISSLMPRLEESVECMKEADRALTRMQDKRQKDIWSLLKFAMAKSKQSPMSASPDSGSLGQVPLWPSSPPGASTTSASSSSANVNGVASAAAAVAPSGPTPGPTTPNSLHSMAAERCEASLMLIAEGHSQMSRCVDVIQETLREQKLDLKTLDWSWLSS